MKTRREIAVSGRGRPAAGFWNKAFIGTALAATLLASGPASAKRSSSDGTGPRQEQRVEIIVFDKGDVVAARRLVRERLRKIVDPKGMARKEADAAVRGLLGRLDGMLGKLDAEEVLRRAMRSRGLDDVQALMVLGRIGKWADSRGFVHSRDPLVMAATEAIMDAWPKADGGKLIQAGLENLTKAQKTDILISVLAARVERAPEMRMTLPDAPENARGHSYVVRILPEDGGGAAIRVRMKLDKPLKEPLTLGLKEFIDGARERGEYDRLDSLTEERWYDMREALERGRVKVVKAK